MKNENERKIKPTGLEKWTDEKISNYIVDLLHESEENDSIVKENIKSKAIIKTAIYISDELITDRNLHHDEQRLPCDTLISLVLEERELQETASIHSMKKTHNERDIKYLREVLRDREKLK